MICVLFKIKIIWSVPLSLSHSSLPLSQIPVFLCVCVSPAEIVYTPNSMSQAEFHLKRILSFLQDAYAYINGQYKSGPLDEPALKKVR